MPRIGNKKRDIAKDRKHWAVSGHPGAEPGGGTVRTWAQHGEWAGKALGFQPKFSWEGVEGTRSSS